MFRVALFTITKTWKKPKCLLTDEKIKCDVCMRMCARAYTHTHKGILLSHKKEQNNAICSNTDATGDYHTK